MHGGQSHLIDNIRHTFCLKFLIIFVSVFALAGCFMPFGGSKESRAVAKMDLGQGLSKSYSDASGSALKSTPSHGSTSSLFQSAENRSLNLKANTYYENATLVEDVVWRGTILIRGFLVISPQTTVRIEPGTVVRFMKSTVSDHKPRLVIMGRIQCDGTVKNTVVFESANQAPAHGDWLGIQILSSDKRNQFSNVRIRGAETAVEARFSTIVANGVEITHSLNGIALYDSNSTLDSVTVNGASKALFVRNSELDIRGGSYNNNQIALDAASSSVLLVGSGFSGNANALAIAGDCRVRISSCEFIDNGSAAIINGGEGQIIRSKFVRNRSAALQLSAARYRISQNLFTATNGDAICLNGGHTVIWNSAFSNNSGFNLKAVSVEDVNAVLNWWGTSDELEIRGKLSIKDNSRSIPQFVFPWLSEKPSSLP